jgi:hypothetical protein
MPSIVANVIFSAIGFAYLTFGRKQKNIPIALNGLLLMFFGYFIDSIEYTAIAGGVLTALPFVFKWW